MKHHHGATSAPRNAPPKKGAAAAAKGATAGADAGERTGTDTAVEQGSMPVVGRDDLVRQTAYFFYEARGRLHGHELEDWLRAEAEIERALAANHPAVAAASSAH
jgi:hypothetical protein